MIKKRYRVADTVITSNVVLPSVQETKEKGEIAFEQGGEPDGSLADRVEWYHDWSDSSEEECWLQFGREHSTDGDGRYVLLFNGLVLFVVSNDLSTVQCYPFPETETSTVQHLFLDQVIPVILSAKRAAVVLHASAVVKDSACIAIVGQSGSGKSTLAGMLCKRGAGFFSDDFLLVRSQGQNGLEAVPSYPGLRVWQDSERVLALEGSLRHPVAHYSSKTRIVIGESADFLNKPTRLSRILFPVFVPADAKAALVRLRGAHEMVNLGKYSFSLDACNEKWQTQEFSVLGKIVKEVPMYRLEVPHAFSRIDEVVELILNSPV